jgi:putative ABC transport system ATP-binding protein
MQGAAANLLLHDDAAGNLAWAVGSRERDDLAVGRRVLRAAGLVGDRRPVGRMTPTEQQVVALAVALAPRPRLLLADEPTSRLGTTARDALLDLLVDTADAAGTAVLVVTHDDAVAARMQRRCTMRDGRVGEEATAEGRWSVLGTDGSLQLPQALRAEWADGALVSVEEVAPGELRVRRVDEGAHRG